MTSFYFISAISVNGQVLGDRKILSYPPVAVLSDIWNEVPNPGMFNPPDGPYTTPSVLDHEFWRKYRHRYERICRGEVDLILEHNADNDALRSVS